MSRRLVSHPRILTLLAGIACIASLFAVPARSAPITVDFVKAEVPPGPTDVPLDFLMNGANDVLFLKFKIHDFDSIATIDSFVINIVLYDDGDRGDEAGGILFALPGPNLPLMAFGPNLNGYTAGAPMIVTITLCPCEIETVFPSLQDSHFRIRIVRLSGDYYVAGGSATIEATLIPEPSSIYSVAGGLFALAGSLVLRRSRSNRA